LVQVAVGRRRVRRRPQEMQRYPWRERVVLMRLSRW